MRLPEICFKTNYVWAAVLLWYISGIVSVLAFFNGLTLSTARNRQLGSAYPNSHQAPLLFFSAGNGNTWVSELPPIPG